MNKLLSPELQRLQDQYVQPLDQTRSVSSSGVQTQHVSMKNANNQYKAYFKKEQGSQETIQNQTFKEYSVASVIMDSHLLDKQEVQEETSVFGYEQPKGFTTKVCPNRYQSFLEIIWNLPSTQGLTGQYYGYIFTTFTLLFAHNMLLMVPGTPIQAVFGSISIGLAMSTILGITLMGIGNFGINFLSFFIPAGAPLAILPLIVVIEMISYCIRSLTLGVRLFANLLAGHALLKSMSGFVFFSARPELSVFATKIPFLQLGSVIAFVFCVYGIELLAHLLQAYIFTLLTAFYLSDLVILDPKKHPPWINQVILKVLQRIRK